MKQGSMKKKIFLLAGMFVFLFVLISMAQVFTARRLKADLDQAAQIQLSTSQAVSHLQAHHLRLRDLLFQSFAATDLLSYEERLSIEKEIGEFSNNLKLTLATLQPLPLTKQTYQSIEAVKAKLEPLSLSSEEVLKKVFEGKKLEVLLKKEDFLKEFTQFSDEISKLVKGVEEDTLKARSLSGPAARSLEIQGIVFNLLWTVFLIGFCGTAFYRVRKSLGLQVQEIQDLLLKLSQNSEKSHTKAPDLKQYSLNLAEVFESSARIYQFSDQILKQYESFPKECLDAGKNIAEIDHKIKILNDHIFQAKLLSLNASVAASQMGESGKAFALIAEDLGKIAHASGENTREITEKVTAAIFKLSQIAEQNLRKSKEFMEIKKEKISSQQLSIEKCRDTLESFSELPREPVEELRQKMGSLVESLKFLVGETGHKAEDNRVSSLISDKVLSFENYRSKAQLDAYPEQPLWAETKKKASNTDGSDKN